MEKMKKLKFRRDTKWRKKLKFRTDKKWRKN